MRGAYAKGLTKRREILDAAIETLAARGYDRASVREVARKVGLSQAGLLHYFSSKEELFVEVLRRRDERVADPGFTANTHPVDRLIDAVAKNSQEPGLTRLFVAMSAEATASEGAARDFFEQRYQWLLDVIAEDIRAQQDAGEMPTVAHPDDLASLVVAVADGLQLQWLLNPSRGDMERRLELLWTLLRTPNP